jgi:glycosyltransferase involved in cell wall biosynthesis
MSKIAPRMSCRPGGGPTVKPSVYAAPEPRPLDVAAGPITGQARVMKVAFLYAAYPPIPDGGAGFLKNLSETLTQMGVEVSVITTSQVASAYPERTDGAIRLYPVMDDWRISRGNYQKLRDLLRRIQPEVIHTIFPSSSVGRGYQSPMLVKLIAPQPLITTLYGFAFRSGGLGSRLAILNLLHLSDRLLSDNDFVIGILRRYLPHLRKKLSYLPSGSNIPNELGQHCRRESVRSQYGLAPEALYVCHFGYLDRTRDLESLFQAVRIQRRRARDVRVVMIGGDPFGIGRPRYEELSGLISRLDLEPYVTWTGFCAPEQVAHYLRCSDLCILPFRRNTTGRSSLPVALSFGLPVITTSRTKALFSLKDHENVILVPPNDVPSLAAAMGELCDHPALRQRLGQAGFKLWQEEFSFEVIGKRVLSIYQEVINKK